MGMAAFWDQGLDAGRVAVHRGVRHWWQHGVSITDLDHSARQQEAGADREVAQHLGQVQGRGENISGRIVRSIGAPEAAPDGVIGSWRRRVRPDMPVRSQPEKDAIPIIARSWRGQDKTCGFRCGATLWKVAPAGVAAYFFQVSRRVTVRLKTDYCTVGGVDAVGDEVAVTLELEAGFGPGGSQRRFRAGRHHGRLAG